MTATNCRGLPFRARQEGEFSLSGKVDPQVKNIQPFQAMTAQQPVSTEKMQYVLESEKERHRLEVQAVVLESFTRRFLISAGLASGMSVLDIGTGAGDVALLAAGIVGPTGRVLGVDTEAGMVNRAQQRAQAKQIENVQFQQSSLLPDEKLGEFDFVISRLVTAFQPDQVNFLRRAASLVKAGGSIVSIEAGWNLCGQWTNPAIPVYDELTRSAISHMEAFGFDSKLGSRLIQLFTHAGLGRPSVAAEFLVGGPDSILLDYTLLNFESLFMIFRGKGLDVPDEDDLNRKYAEIREAAASSHVQFNGPCIVGASLKIEQTFIE
jgi:SAM-dependent methyltransferase